MKLQNMISYDWINSCDLDLVFFFFFTLGMTMRWDELRSGLQALLKLAKPARKKRFTPTCILWIDFIFSWCGISLTHPYVKIAQLVRESKYLWMVW